MFYSNSSFWLYFCNTVALVLWENKILIKTVQKYMFQNEVPVFDHIWRPGLYFLTPMCWGDIEGKEQGCDPLFPGGAVGVAWGICHLTWEWTFYPMDISCSVSPSPPKKSGCMKLFFTDTTHKNSFWGLLTPAPKHRCRNIAVPRTMYLWGHLHLFKNTLLFQSMSITSEF